MAVQRTHYVCPRNGEPTYCPEDGVRFPHRREELRDARHKPPRCDTHRLVMLPAPRGALL